MYQNDFLIKAKELLQVICDDRETHIIQAQKDYFIKHSAVIGEPCNNSLMFCTKEYWKESYADLLITVKESFIILEDTIELGTCVIHETNTVIFHKFPKLCYIRLLTKALETNEKLKTYQEKENAIIMGENVKVGSGSVIEPGVFLDYNVTIGEDCIIRAGAKIRGNVTIGDHCRIGENCIIGHEGLAVATDEHGQHYRIPHIGGVMIENWVDIGANTTVASGTIQPTIIRQYVSMGERNQISHNCEVGVGSIISGNVVITGGVHVGQNVWIGPNATIINGITLGDYSKILIGSVVFKDVAEHISVMGNPARVMKQDTEEKRENIPNMIR